MSVVYFLLAGGLVLVKIGTTRNLRYRIDALTSANASPVRLLGHIPGDRRVEAAWHSEWWRYRKHGEWFAYEQPLEAAIRAALAGEAAPATRTYTREPWTQARLRALIGLGTS